MATLAETAALVAMAELSASIPAVPLPPKSDRARLGASVIKKRLLSVCSHTLEC